MTATALSTYVCMNQCRPVPGAIRLHEVNKTYIANEGYECHEKEIELTKPATYVYEV